MSLLKIAAAAWLALLSLGLAPAVAAGARAGEVLAMGGQCFVLSGEERAPLKIGDRGPCRRPLDVPQGAKLKLRMDDGSIIAAAANSQVDDRDLRPGRRREARQQDRSRERPAARRGRRGRRAAAVRGRYRDRGRRCALDRLVHRGAARLDAGRACSKARSRCRAPPPARRCASRPAGARGSRPGATPWRRACGAAPNSTTSSRGPT